MSPLSRFRPGDRVDLVDGRTAVVENWAAEGSHARVYRGRLQPAGEAVAIKLARSEIGCAADLLVSEGEILRAVTHPRLAGILGTGNGSGAPFLVLEWLEGDTLRERWEHLGRRLAVRGALELLSPLLGGVECLHTAGRRHGDVRMENVILSPRGPVLFDPLPASLDPEAPAPRDDAAAAVEMLYRLLGGRHERARPLPGIPSGLNSLFAAGVLPDLVALRQTLSAVRERL